jgi:hypothetical protein
MEKTHGRDESDSFPMSAPGICLPLHLFDIFDDAHLCSFSLIPDYTDSDNITGNSEKNLSETGIDFAIALLVLLHI